MGLVALQHVGSSLPRTEPASPALAGVFITTDSPRKPPDMCLENIFIYSLACLFILCVFHQWWNSIYRFLSSMCYAFGGVFSHYQTMTKYSSTPILWPPDVKSWLIKKDPDAGKDWRQKEKGTTEDEMVEWHNQLSGHEFEQTDGEGQGSLGVAKSQTWLSNWTTTKLKVT